VIDGVARRREQLYYIAELVVALHDFVALCGDDREDGVRDPGGGRRIFFLCLSPVSKLAVREDILGLSSSANSSSTSAAGSPGGSPWAWLLNPRARFCNASGIDCSLSDVFMPYLGRAQLALI
jgi:hypothetical protein